MAQLLLRYIWASPNTLVGFLLALLGRITGGGWQVHSGVLEGWGGFPAWCMQHLTLVPGGAAAITFGHVVLAKDERQLHQTRIHERVHVEQYGRWGALFLPAYLISSTVALIRGGDPYRDNLFERTAYRIEAEEKARSDWRSF